MASFGLQSYGTLEFFSPFAVRFEIIMFNLIYIFIYWRFLTFQKNSFKQLTFYFMTKKSVKLTAEKVQKIIKDILFRRLVELERYAFLQTAPMVFKAIKKTLQILLFANNHNTNQCFVFKNYFSTIWYVK